MNKFYLAFFFAFFQLLFAAVKTFLPDASLIGRCNASVAK
jgi:hypothetical protein